jgi:hypothetical protein
MHLVLLLWQADSANCIQLAGHGHMQACIVWRCCHHVRL